MKCSVTHNSVEEPLWTEEVQSREVMEKEIDLYIFKHIPSGE